MSVKSEIGKAAFGWLHREPEDDGESKAAKEISVARREAEARAMRILAERECPSDIVEWGRLHRIPEFARLVWMNGFQAGMRVAELDRISANRFDRDGRPKCGGGK